MVWILRKALETPFQLVNRWGFALLLDEAEQVLYLFKVLGIPAERDSLSSFRLRVSRASKKCDRECFLAGAGLLLQDQFLDSHSVETFDPASQSRTRIKFFYPKLDPRTPLKVEAMSVDRARKTWAEILKSIHKTAERSSTSQKNVPLVWKGPTNSIMTGTVWILAL